MDSNSFRNSFLGYNGRFGIDQKKSHLGSIPIGSLWPNGSISKSSEVFPEDDNGDQKLSLDFMSAKFNSM